MLSRAMATKGRGGAQPDPAILKDVWSRLDPALTATKEGAMQAWSVALGYTHAIADAPAAPRGEGGKFTSLAPPLHSEKAGGRDTPTNSLALNAAEKKFIKDAGMSEAEYIKSQPAWMRR